MKSKKIKNICIIGGGRWSKEIIRTLDRFVDKNIAFVIFSKHNYFDLKKWIKTFEIRKIILIRKIDKLKQIKPDTLIIVNSAKDHFKTCMMALQLKKSALIEKPVGMTLKEVEKIFEQSKINKFFLGASNIFLYNDYLINFKNIIENDSQKYKSIEFTWFDKQNEIRNGEAKTYDPTVPIYIDCMHHICSILSLFTKIKLFNIEDFNFKKGGSHIQFKIINKNLDIKVNLARNKKIRSRKLKIITKKDKVYVLNFSKEPGFIKVNNKKIISDPDWILKKKPLQKMLENFLNVVIYNKNSEKLNFQISLDSAKICNNIDKIYKLKQNDWSNKINRSNIKKYSRDFEYFVKETFLIRNEIDENSLEKYLKNE